MAIYVSWCSTFSSLFADKTHNPEDSGDGEEEHDDADDTSCEKRSLSAVEAKLTENNWGIVQDTI